MQRALAGLRGVEGLLGSFVVDASGTLLATDVPLAIGHEALRDVGPRLLAAIDAIGLVCPDATWCALHFQAGRLSVWPFPSGTLIVLTEPRVNMRALKVAGKVVARRLARAAMLPPPSPRATRAGAIAALGTSLPSFEPVPRSTPLPPAGLPEVRDSRPPASGAREVALGQRTPTQPSMLAPSVGAETFRSSSVPTEEEVSAAPVTCSRTDRASSAPVRDSTAPSYSGGTRTRTIIYRGRKYRVPD